MIYLFSNSLILTIFVLRGSGQIFFINITGHARASQGTVGQGVWTCI